jgi:hypothetical protein
LALLIRNKTEDDLKDIKQQEDFLDKLLSEANENGKDHELRFFACWCARETNPRKYCLEAIELSERYANRLIGLDELKTRQKEMVGFEIATATIGMNCDLQLAHSDMCSFQTLRESALEAAMLSKSHYLSYSKSKAEIERLSLQQIELLMIETISCAIDEMNEFLAHVKEN